MTMVNLSKLGLKPLKLIGSGSDGVVIKAEKIKTGEIFAVKIVNVEKGNAEYFEREAMNVLTLCSHSNIVKTKGYHVISKEYGVIVMEFIKGDLMEYYLAGEMKSPMKVKKIFYNMCKAVAHCHSRNVAHLDIKPENFLYNKAKKQVKLCDFHHSFKWRNEKQKFQRFYNLTSLNYRAPEIPVTSDKIVNYHVTDDVTPYALDKVDVWCLGVCLFGFLFSEFPFQRDSDGFIRYDYKSFNRKLKSANISDSAKDLISILLAENADDRPDVIDLFDHPFFFGISNDKYFNN